MDIDVYREDGKKYVDILEIPFGPALIVGAAVGFGLLALIGSFLYTLG